jgi:hypothetical protein
MRKEINAYPLSWHPKTGGKLAPIVFRDDVTKSLGPDPTGTRLQKIAELILSGNYYPRHVIKFTPTEAPIKIGTRIRQSAPIIPGLPWPVATGITEIFVAEETENSLHVGYVTTTRHHARGIWQAKINRDPTTTELTIHVWDTVNPQSFLFWVGLPYARFLQQRALYSAIKRFQTEIG